VFLLAIMKGRR